MIKRIHSTLFLCKNLSLTAQFYKQVGFLVEQSNDAVRIIFGDYRLAFIDETKATVQDDKTAQKGVGTFIYFEVEDVDSFYRDLKEKNIIIDEPESKPWGKREVLVKDPDGYKIIFFSNL
ncbi:MAG: VOC family protein [bacterium]